MTEKCSCPDLDRKVKDLTDAVEKSTKIATALKKTSNFYKAFFNSSPDGIIVLDPETKKPILFNKNAHQQLGYSREEFAQLRITDIEVSDPIWIHKGYTII